jgi:hypothetical protein
MPVGRGTRPSRSSKGEKQQVKIQAKIYHPVAAFQGKEAV